MALLEQARSSLYQAPSGYRSSACTTSLGSLDFCLYAYGWSLRAMTSRAGGLGDPCGRRRRDVTVAAAKEMTGSGKRRPRAAVQGLQQVSAPVFPPPPQCFYVAGRRSLLLQPLWVLRLLLLEQNPRQQNQTLLRTETCDALKECAPGHVQSVFSSRLNPRTARMHWAGWNRQGVFMNPGAFVFQRPKP